MINITAAWAIYWELCNIFLVPLASFGCLRGTFGMSGAALGSKPGASVNELFAYTRPLLLRVSHLNRGRRGFDR